MKKIAFALICAAVLAGCASPYKEFYSDATGGIDVKSHSRAIMTSGEPIVFRGIHPNIIEKQLTEDGYLILGRSSFNAGDASEAGAITQAKSLHAAAVALYSEYRNTVSGSTPLTLPTTTQSSTYVSGMVGNRPVSGTATTYTQGTQTTYIPYSVDRYNYYASYWIKAKPPILGAQVDDLTPEIRRAIGSNKGVRITAVVKGSPAFKADLLEDDVIKNLGFVDTDDQREFYDALQFSAGKTVDVVVFRDGKKLTKSVTLNTRD